jgi:hypothetical protein
MKLNFLILALVAAFGPSTITVKGAKDTLMMTVTPTTKFKGGASLADFKVGDNVTGSYVKDETGKMTASSLHKKVAKP